MARTFTTGTQVYHPNFFVATPFTFVAWVYSTSSTANQTILWAGNASSSNQYYRLGLRGDVGGDPVEFQESEGARTHTARTSTGYSINTWTFCAGSSTSSTACKALINGGSKGTDSGLSITLGSADRTSIGYAATSTPDNYFQGLLAEVAIYNGELSDGLIAKMYNSRASFDFFPTNMIAYYKLLFDDNNNGSYAPFGTIEAMEYITGRHAVDVVAATKGTHIPNFRQR